jgi:hypothetical protein
MVTDDGAYQLPLTAALAGGSRGHQLRDLLRSLDEIVAEEIEAETRVDLERSGGRVGRPVPYYCSNRGVYWVKTEAQTGLSSELIGNRLAHQLGIGPATSIVRLDPFLAVIGDSTRGVGTADVSPVLPSKALGPGNAPIKISSDGRARACVFQSWIDVADEQLLISTTDGRVYSNDHGEAFRELLPGPPRIVLADTGGLRLDWSSSFDAGLEMVSAIEELTDYEILVAVAGIPDEVGWNALFDRRLAIAKWLMKRREMLRVEYIKWSRSVA